MLTLRESINLDMSFEQWQTNVTDDIIDQAEYYNLDWDAVAGKAVISLYDENSSVLCSVSFNDADMAIEFIQEYFELDESDVADLESYNWVNDFDAEDNIV